MTVPPGDWLRVYNPESGDTPDDEGWWTSTTGTASQTVTSDRLALTGVGLNRLGERSDVIASPLRDALTTSFEVISGRPQLFFTLQNGNDGRHVDISISDAEVPGTWVAYFTGVAVPVQITGLDDLDFSTGQHTVTIDVPWDAASDHFTIDIDGTEVVVTVTFPVGGFDNAAWAAFETPDSNPREYRLDYFAVGRGGGGKWRVGSTGWS